MFISGVARKVPQGIFIYTVYFLFCKGFFCIGKSFNSNYNIYMVVLDKLKTLNETVFFFFFTRKKVQ